MKIAQIAPPWFAVPPKNYGGTETVMSSLIEEQVAQGYDVTLFGTGDSHTSARLVSFLPKALIESGVPWAAHLSAYYHMCKSVEAISEGDFDIVHTHLSSASDMYLFPLMAHFNKPHVMTLHSRYPFDRLPSGWKDNADDYYMRDWGRSMPMVAISEHARAEVPYPLNFAGVVYHGLPMDIFRPTGRPREKFFVWLGRCVPDKGTHLAIDAAQAAGAPIVLAGTVDRNNPESVRYFNEKVKPRVNNTTVKYIGPVNLQEKIRLLSRARGFLNPIEWEEPFGMVMIEAMALGCPVITFDRGAAPELVVDGKTGFIVHDVDEMIRAMPRIDDIDRAATRQHVEVHFSARVMAESYLKVYRRVIDTWKGPSDIDEPLSKLIA